MKLSFLIPCYGSEHTITSVVDEIYEKMGERPELDYEIICVNDASPDQVFSVLCRLAAENPRVKVLDLAKNMGKHGASMAGYASVTGDIVVCLDDDGQCPVDRLWDLLAPLDEGYDFVMAKYPEKKQTRFRNFGSSVNSLMARALLNKPKDLQFSNFSAMKRFVSDEILRYRNPYPYIDGLLLRAIDRIKNVEMEERERISGTSGYTLSKCLKLWMNGFTAFSVKPLRLAAVLGLFVAAIGFLFSVYVVAQKVLHPEIAAGYSSLMAVILFIGGVIMLLLGVIGEYVGRIYISLNAAPQYVVRQTINLSEEAQERVRCRVVMNP